MPNPTSRRPTTRMVRKAKRLTPHGKALARRLVLSGRHSFRAIGKRLGVSGNSVIYLTRKNRLKTNEEIREMVQKHRSMRTRESKFAKEVKSFAVRSVRRSHRTLPQIVETVRKRFGVEVSTTAIQYWAQKKNVSRPSNYAPTMFQTKKPIRLTALSKRWRMTETQLVERFKRPLMEKNPRWYWVLHWRSQDPPLTLDEIGKKWPALHRGGKPTGRIGVTRENVRQTESNAIDCLEALIRGRS